MTLPMHRRTWLIGTAAATTALTIPIRPAQAAPAARTLSNRCLPYGHSGQGSGTPPTAPSTPVASAAFTDAEVAILTQLVDAILPADASASAVSLGTVDYVKAGLSMGGADALAPVKQGLAAIDGIALQLHGAGFAQLQAAQRDAVVAVVTQTAPLLPLWLGVRTLAVLHYYAQPLAYTDLALPGPSIDKGGFPRPNTVPCAA